MSRLKASEEMETWVGICLTRHDYKEYIIAVTFGDILTILLLKKFSKKINFKCYVLKLGV